MNTRRFLPVLATASVLAAGAVLADNSSAPAASHTLPSWVYVDEASRSVAEKVVPQLIAAGALPVKGQPVWIVTQDIDPAQTNAADEGGAVRGAFIAASERGDHTIVLDPDAPEPAFVLAHELGHYVDALGVDTLAVAREAASKPTRVPCIEGATCDYEQDPAELFARAYAQWAAEVTEDDDLLRSARVGEFSPQQWADGHWGTIGALVDQAVQGF